MASYPEFPFPSPQPVAADVRVSVIIGNYNYAQFINESIDSVLNQTYQNIELIVVDDGSKDQSREVIEGYGDRLVAIFQDNGGQGSAFTTGLKRAKGEIICFLDADDYFHPEKVAKVVEGFVAHPKWVQLSCGIYSIDKDGELLGEDSNRFSCGDVRGLLLKYGRYGWTITSGLAYRREVLEAVLPLPKRPRAADTFLTATIPFYGQVGGIPEYLSYRRLHGKNRRGNTANFGYMIEQRNDTCDCINRAAEQTGVEERFAIERDLERISYVAAHEDSGSLIGGLKIGWKTFWESLDIDLGVKEGLRLVFKRTMCTMSPTEGPLALSLGPKRYLLCKLRGDS